MAGIEIQDGLFALEPAHELHHSIPGNNKEFWGIKDAIHAKFPPTCWNDLAKWFDKQEFE